MEWCGSTSFREENKAKKFRKISNNFWNFLTLFSPWNYVDPASFHHLVTYTSGHFLVSFSRLNLAIHKTGRPRLIKWRIQKCSTSLRMCPKNSHQDLIDPLSNEAIVCDQLKLLNMNYFWMSRKNLTILGSVRLIRASARMSPWVTDTIEVFFR